jgi:hypothetical protein
LLCVEVTRPRRKYTRGIKIFKVNATKNPNEKPRLRAWPSKECPEMHGNKWFRWMCFSYQCNEKRAGEVLRKTYHLHWEISYFCVVVLCDTPDRWFFKKWLPRNCIHMAPNWKVAVACRQRGPSFMLASLGCQRVNLSVCLFIFHSQFPWTL